MKGTQRFRKREQLLCPFQYKHVYRDGSIQKSPHVWVYSTSNGLAHSRLGISVAKKKCANLVERNKLKRIIREVFRLNKAMFGKGCDFVVVIKKCPAADHYNVIGGSLLSMAKNDKKSSDSSN